MLILHFELMLPFLIAFYELENGKVGLCTIFYQLQIFLAFWWGISMTYSNWQIDSSLLGHKKTKGKHNQVK